MSLCWACTAITVIRKAKLIKVVRILSAKYSFELPNVRVQRAAAFPNQDNKIPAAAPLQRVVRQSEGVTISFTGEKPVDIFMPTVIVESKLYMNSITT